MDNVFLHFWWLVSRIFTEAKYQVKWFLQRHIRGFCDPEWYNLDQELAKWVLPRLIYLKENSIGYPAAFAEENDGLKKWEDILDRIIFAFEYQAYKKWDTDKKKETLEEEDRLAKEGIELFAKYYRNLWD